MSSTWAFWASASFLVAGLEHFLKLAKLAYLRFPLGRAGELGLLGLLGDHARALGLQLCGHLVSNLLLQRALGIGKLLLFVAKALLALGDVFVLLGKLLLEVVARRSEQRGCERLRERKFGLAVRANDGGFRHRLLRSVPWRTVLNTDSIGFVVRRCTRCSAGKYRKYKPCPRGA